MMMNLAAPARYPVTPLAIDPQKPINMDVVYWTPSFQKSHLGGTPTDFFDNSPKPSEGPYVVCTPEKCGPLPTEIYYNNPLLAADGTPKMRRNVKRIQDAPASPMNQAALWGLIGGGTAGTIGVLAGAVLGQTLLGGVVGAVVGGVVAGGIGAMRAKGDRIQLVWDAYPINNIELVGYKEEVKPGAQGGVQGFQHHFVPDLRSRKVGEYKIPRVVHYKEEAP